MYEIEVTRLTETAIKMLISALKVVLILYWEDSTEHRLCIEDLPYQLCSAYISFQLCFIIKIEMSNKFWRF